MKTNQYNHLVCVRCYTYQQASYIEDALIGFCMQQTNFPYICIVVDDASTDGEQDVINRYIAEYFDLEDKSVSWTRDAEEGVYTYAQHKTNKNCFILSLNLKKNLFKEKGAKAKLIAEWRDSCKYEAVCEGDDYWTDPLKLQKQVDILEADESLMACCTNCSVVDMNGNILEKKRIQSVVKDNKQGRYSLRYFFDQGHQYPTLSVLYRNTHRDEVRQKTTIMRNPYMGDWTLWIALLCFGDMYYLDEVTCAYRINPTSLTHDQSKMAQRRLGYAKMQFTLLPKVASILPEHGFEDIKDDLINNTAWKWWNLANAQRKCHHYFQMVYSLIRCLVKNPKYFIEKILGK